MLARTFTFTAGMSTAIADGPRLIALDFPRFAGCASRFGSTYSLSRHWNVEECNLVFFTLGVG